MQSSETKRISGLWWSLEIPESWSVEETRSGKILTLKESQDATLELLSLKKDIGNVLEADFTKFVSAGESVKCIDRLDVVYAKVDNYGGDPNIIRWGVSHNSHLLIATFRAGSEKINNSRVEDIERKRDKIPILSR